MDKLQITRGKCKILNLKFKKLKKNSKTYDWLAYLMTNFTHTSGFFDSKNSNWRSQALKIEENNLTAVFFDDDERTKVEGHILNAIACECFLCWSMFS